MAYQEPEWSQIPPPEYQQWFLLEIKGGVQVAKYPLHDRKCTILGRAADQVHIPLSHESISRQHARIAFDSQGIPWLRDLQSTHGTTCNKRRLPPLTIGKQETNAPTKGARGVMIFPGDMLQFGASTRIFCLEGPSQFERGAIQARQIQQQQQQQMQMQMQMQKNGVEASTVTTVGMDATNDDDEDETDQATNHYKIVPMDAEVPEKHRKSLERLNAMKYKLQNIETEDDRIRRKGELSEGQERQLQRNAEKEKQLQESILSLETELYDKLHPEQLPTGRQSQQHSGKHDDEEEDDDDFFDRTKRKDKSIVEDEESESTLIAKWKRFQKENIERQITAIPAAQAEVDKLSMQHAALEDRGDTEEAFFVQNTLNLAKETLSKVMTEQEKTEATLTEIEKFLRLVNSKVRFDRNTGYIGEGNPTKPKPAEPLLEVLSTASYSMAPPPSRGATSIPTSQNDDPLSMPPPPPKFQKSPRVPQSKQDFCTTLSSDTVLPEILMPPPKRKRVAGPALCPTPGIATSTRQCITPSTPNDKPVKGTLSFLSSMTNESSDPIPISAATNSHESPVFTKGKTELDLTKDEWRAPSGQDGSGITKLNAKFAGRY